MTAVPPALRQALRRILQSLVRLLLRHGIAYAEFAELSKQTYVDVAKKDFAVPGRKQSHSRIAVITGIHRREVKKLLSDEGAEPTHYRRHNRAARVISAWMRENAYTENGLPRTLTLHDEFIKLVSQHGGDVPPRAVLDELLRIGAAKRLGHDRVYLVVPAYTPSNSPEDALHILGDSVSDLISTIDHNLQSDIHNNRLQLSVVYTDVPNDALEHLSEHSKHKALSFLREIDGDYMRYDRSHNVDLKGKGRNRVGLGVYYFEKPYEEI